MSKKSKHYMLDTSAVIDDPTNIIRLYDGGENIVFINNVVYGELNNLKKSTIGEAGFQAREFFRLIKDTPIRILNAADFPSGIKKKIVNKHKDSIVEFKMIKDGEEAVFYSVIRKTFKSIIDNIVSMGDEINDLCISEIALDYKMKLITNDGGLHVHHQISGGQSDFIFNNTYASPSSQQYLFEIKVPISTLERKDGKLKCDLIKFISTDGDKSIYPDFTQFKFIEVGIQKNNGEEDTEYESGRVEFGIKIGNTVEIVDFGNEGVMSDSLLHWKNHEQGLYYHILTHPKNRITTVSGATGSGKTLIALAAGLELQKKGLIEGIIYTRNTVTSTDQHAELGFRKGGEDVKLGYFMLPLFSAINFLIGRMKVDSKNGLNAQVRYFGNENSMNKENATEIFMRDNNIEVVDIAHLRGTTISNKLIILDEAQNLSVAGLKLIGTRSGDGSRFLILGDGNQIDHPFLSKNRNSLARMMDIASKDDFVAGLKLTSTVRSDIAEWFDQNL